MGKLLLLTIAAMLFGAAPAAAETPQEMSHNSCSYYKYNGIEYPYCPEGQITVAQAQADINTLAEYGSGLTETLQAGLGAEYASWWFNYHRGQFEIRVPEGLSQTAENTLAETIDSRYRGWIPQALIEWNTHQHSDARLASAKAEAETSYSQQLTQFIAEKRVRINLNVSHNGLEMLANNTGFTKAQVMQLETDCVGLIEGVNCKMAWVAGP